MKEKMQRFMYGRYGVDDLGKFLNIFILIIIVLSFFIKPFALLSLALLIFQYFRILSRNTYKRLQENEKYIDFRCRIKKTFSIYKKRFIQRNTHKFYKCPSCRQILRVPRGKGKITITCPKCTIQFEEKS